MKKLYLLLICLSITAVSCTKDFEQMNENWKSPKGTDIGPLFNGLISSLQLTWDEQFYLSNEVFYPETELGALISDGWGNTSIGTEAVWSNYYYALANVRDLESRFDELCGESNDTAICDLARAQVIILKAYKTFKVTDIFGDIPYTQAGRIWQPENDSVNYRKPKFDTQESIYKSLLNELVWARDVLSNATEQTPSGNDYLSLSSFDPLMYGSLAKWAKFANSLILRHGLRCYHKDPEFATPLLAEAFHMPIIDDMDGVCMWPSKLGYENTSVSWSFREHKNLRMGETIWEYMSTSYDTTGADIFDYRAYIFFDTNNGAESQPNMGNWVPFPQIRTSDTPSEGGAPYSTNRDVKYSLKGAACIYSPFNYYLTRDQKYIPEILMTYADALFMKAEVAALGIVNVSTTELGMNYFEQGIYQSFLFWTQMPIGATIWQYRYPAYAELMDNSSDVWAASTNMASRVSMGTYMKFGFPSSPADYLPLIYAQRWINLLRQPWEAWALTRRTMGTPTTTDHAKLTSYRLTYPPTEIEYNYDEYDKQVAKMNMGDSRQTKVWWMPESY